MRRTIGRWVAAVLAAAALSAPAGAKVVFTGYGDFRATPQGRFRIDGPPAFLSTLGLGPEQIETRSNTISALGLFATTSISENAKFQMDLTFRNIGATAKTTAIQYAYVDYAAYGADALFGKITLPFGYYNQNRFYPFQRPSITAPVFQNAILGVPIADVGATVGRPFEIGDAVIKADVYVINGYGALPGSTSTFRSASVPSGALTIANNISGTSSNHRYAFGGRLDVSHKRFEDSSVGVSYYHGEWDPAGRNLFQMANAHVHARAAGFELLAEYLFLNAMGDQGMIQNFGSPAWRTDGFFAELDYDRVSAWGKPVTPWVRWEEYRSHASGADGGREKLEGVSGGFSVRLQDQVLVKTEGSYLNYHLPFVAANDLVIEGASLQLGLAVTF